MEGESASPTKCKLKPVNESEILDSSNNHVQTEQPNVEVSKSPLTKPMLLPELWAKIFEYMSPDELQTLINTTPEWNRMLHSEKPGILFPKVLTCMAGYIHWKDILQLRVVSKACKLGVEAGYPEFPAIIWRCEEIAKAMERIKANILLRMRYDAREGQMEAQGLPVQDVREVKEEPVRENEFSEEQFEEYVRRCFQSLRLE